MMRFEKQRIAIIGWIVLRIIITLAGRGVQVIRKDARSASGGEWLHHAPLCGANHYHHARPITTKCTCGAEAAQNAKAKLAQ